MDQGVNLGVWLGLAGLGLFSSALGLWRTRRDLSRLGENIDLPEAGRVPAVVAEPVSFVRSP